MWSSVNQGEPYT